MGNRLHAGKPANYIYVTNSHSGPNQAGRYGQHNLYFRFLSNENGLAILRLRIIIK